MIKPDRPTTTSLPQYLEQHSRWIIEIPARILIVLVVAFVVRALLHRMINRMVRPVEQGGVPPVLRRLRHQSFATNLFAESGRLHERRAQRAAAVASILRSGVSFVIFMIAFVTVLSEVGIDVAPFLAGSSIIGVAVAFGAQNIIKDLLAGIFMIMEDQYGVGDVIDFEKATGTVEAVGLRTTRLRDVNGTVWYVRNGEVVRVGNKSQGFAQVVLDVPIAAAADVARASAAMRDVAHTMSAEEGWSELFLAEPEVQGVEALTLDSTTIRVVARVRPLEQWRVARELRQRIRARLDRLDIPAEPESVPA
ncbi:MAG: mechanosensitive ion channel family protein [Jatrophihabitans sp.]|uniref:mechanosensitive ion channel family protein n=1 Tax=Jatrophihabitans sp. TaxID=1932789 RepID=UPI003F7E00B0